MMTATVWSELERRVAEPADDGAPDVWGTLGERLDVVRSRPELGDWVVVRKFDLPYGNSYAIAGNRRELVYYRLSHAEADVLALLDGTRTVGEVVVQHLQASGELDMLAIVELVRSLHEGNFLTDPYLDTDAAVQRALHPDTGAARRVRPVPQDVVGRVERRRTPRRVPLPLRAAVPVHAARHRVHRARRASAASPRSRRWRPTKAST